jgi:hypothetical protein
MTTKKKGTIERVVESAADAAVELGEAAKGFKESWAHVKKAQSKAHPATQAAKRATRAVTRATKRVIKRK